MKRYHGKDLVGPGIYFEPRQLSFRSVEHEDRLPGDERNAYLRVPWIMLLFLGPILGLAYVLFLPFIGLAMVAGLLVEKAGDVAAGALRAAVRAARPGWEPSLAFLSRSKAKRTPRPESDEWAEETRKKLVRDEERESE